MGILICWPIYACAANHNTDQQPALIESQIETEFSVESGKMTVRYGNKQASKTDNSYLLSALNAQKIFINKYDYSVTVSRKQYRTESSIDDDHLELFHYSIKFPASKSTLEEEFPSLDENNVVETDIPLSKAPTKCYVFTDKQRLNLLCHYGFRRNATIPTIIALMKRND